MKTRRFFTITLTIVLSFSAISYRAQAQEPAKRDKHKTVAPAAASNPVIGSGTPGRLSKWTGVDGANSFSLGNSNIFEDKFGKVGIGTTTPTSPLTVQGMIETTLGGYKFPDGTVQNSAFNPGQVVRSLNGLTGEVQLAGSQNITITKSGNTLTVAAPNALTAVAHDATLTGNGTPASPLGVASPLEVRDRDNPARQPVQLRGNCNLNNMQVICTTTPLTYLVPQGKRLVIEYASMQASMPEGQSVTMFIQVEIPNTLLIGRHFLPLSAPAHDGVNAGGPFTSVGQVIRIYVEPGLTVVVNGARNNGTGSANYELSLSGHLVDLP